MPEREPDKPTKIEFLSTGNKIMRFTCQSADARNLDTLSADALFKYANLCYRIKDLDFNFNGTTTKRVFYPFRDEEKGILYELMITRREYREKLQLFKAIKDDLYNSYFTKKPNLRAAAEDVLNFVDDQFPKI